MKNPKYSPSEADLLNNFFEQSPNNMLKHMWYREIKPLNPAPSKIIYNSRENVWRYSRFHYRIENVEELQTLIRLLSKWK
jgi:hypothetical protein